MNMRKKMEITAKMSSSVTASARCRVEELRLMVFWMSRMSAVILSMSLFCLTVLSEKATIFNSLQLKERKEMEKPLSVSAHRSGW